MGVVWGGSGLIGLQGHYESFQYDFDIRRFVGGRRCTGGLSGKLFGHWDGYWGLDSESCCE